MHSLNIVATLETTISRMPAKIEASAPFSRYLLDNHATMTRRAPEARDFSIDAHRRSIAHDGSGRVLPAIDSLRCRRIERKKELAGNRRCCYVSSLLDWRPDRPSDRALLKIVATKRSSVAIHVANAAIAKASEQADSADEIKQLKPPSSSFPKGIGKAFRVSRRSSVVPSISRCLCQRGNDHRLATHSPNWTRGPTVCRSQSLSFWPRALRWEKRRCDELAESAAIDEGKSSACSRWKCRAKLWSRLLCAVPSSTLTSCELVSHTR